MQKATVIAIGEGKNPQNLLLTVLVQERNSKRKRKYEITPDDYERIGSPPVNCELSEYDLKIISRSANDKDAVSVAYRILAHCDNNRASLKRKLIERGFREETAEETVEKMVSLGYIDEHQQLSRFVLRLANHNLYGERKIYPYLIARGYRREDIECAIAELLDSGELDFNSAKGKLIESKGLNESERSKIRALLYKYGHDDSFDL